jgi:hypothetical protein
MFHLIFDKILYRFIKSHKKLVYAVKHKDNLYLQLSFDILFQYGE